MGKEEKCQNELQLYEKLHLKLHQIHTNPQGSPLARSDTFKNKMDELAVKLMRAETGDDLLAVEKTMKEMLEFKGDDNKPLLSDHEKQTLLKSMTDIVKAREPHLPEPFKDQSHSKGAVWIGLGTGIIATALALTVVGAPLIPAAVAGGAALAYGLADNVKELAEHKNESSEKANGKMHHGKGFNEFKDHLDKKVHHKDATYANRTDSAEKVVDYKQYLKSAPDPAHKPKEKSGFLKKLAKGLAVAGIGLAIAAMAAVFPPVGIPIAAAVAIGAVSTAVIAGAGVAYGKQYLDAKQEHQKLQDEVTKERTDISKDLVQAAKTEAAKPSATVEADKTKAPTTTDDAPTHAVAESLNSPNPTEATHQVAIQPQPTLHETEHPQPTSVEQTTEDLRQQEEEYLVNPANHSSAEQLHILEIATPETIKKVEPSPVQTTTLETIPEAVNEDEDEDEEGECMGEPT